MRVIAVSVIFLFISLAASGMPASFYQAMANMDTSNYLCVKNYDAGASVTESYSDFDQLEKETEVISQSFHPSGSVAEGSRGNATLKASMSSSFAGKAHIAWQSRDTEPGIYGRHEIYGLAQEDLTGVYSIEKFIHLSSNRSCALTRPDWLSCI